MISMGRFRLGESKAELPFVADANLCETAVLIACVRVWLVIFDERTSRTIVDNRKRRSPVN